MHKNYRISVSVVAKNQAKWFLIKNVVFCVIICSEFQIGWRLLKTLSSFFIKKPAPVCKQLVVLCRETIYDYTVHSQVLAQILDRFGFPRAYSPL